MHTCKSSPTCRQGRTRADKMPHNALKIFRNFSKYAIFPADQNVIISVDEK